LKVSLGHKVDDLGHGLEVSVCLFGNTCVCQIGNLLIPAGGDSHQYLYVDVLPSAPSSQLAAAAAAAAAVAAATNTNNANTAIMNHHHHILAAAATNPTILNGVFILFICIRFCILSWHQLEAKIRFLDLT